MITKTSLRGARLMEFSQVMANVKTFLSKENLSDLNLTQLAAEFNTQLTTFEEVLKPLRKSENTKKIKNLDEKRDSMLMGFIGHCKLFSYFPDEPIAEAAQKLVLVVEKYGKSPQRLSLREETATIKNLLEAVKKPEVHQAVNAIGAEKWLMHLETANMELEKLHTDRTEEKATVEAGKTKEEREKMQEAFTKLATAINGLAVIYGKEKYKNLMNVINEEVKRVLVKKKTKE